MSPILNSLGSLAARAFGFGAVTTAPFAPSGAFDALATITVPSGGAASVLFSGIPSTYKHLQLRCFTQGNRGTYPVDGFYLRFNGDSTSGNYRGHLLQGQGTGSAASGDDTAAAQLDLGQPGTNASNGAFAATVVDIFDYASVTKNKVTRALNGLDVNGTVAGYGGIISFRSGTWYNSSTAISSIYLAPAIGTSWNQYSSFALYGVK